MVSECEKKEIWPDGLDEIYSDEEIQELIERAEYWRKNILSCSDIMDLESGMDLKREKEMFEHNRNVMCAKMFRALSSPPTSKLFCDYFSNDKPWLISEN